MTTATVSRAAFLASESALADGEFNIHILTRPSGSPRALLAESALVLAMASVMLACLDRLIPSATPAQFITFGSACVGGYLFARSTIGLRCPAAMIASLAYCWHPLVHTIERNPSNPISAFVSLLVPFVLMNCDKNRRIIHRAFTIIRIAIIALLVWLEPATGLPVAIACGIWIASQHGGTDSRFANGFRSSAAVVGVASVIWCIGPTNPTIAGLGVSAEKLLPIGPLAWIDREQVFSSSLAALPQSVFGNNGGCYLSWCLVALCLVALIPMKRTPDVKDSGLLISLALALLWLGRTGESFHRQWTELFAFATVRRFAGEKPLHMLGIAAGLTILLLLVGGLAARSVLAVGRNLTFPGALMIGALIMAAWALTPPTVLSGPIHRGWQTEIVAREFTALALASCAGIGVQRFLEAYRRSAARLAVTFAVLFAIAIDLIPPTVHALTIPPATGSSTTLAPPEIRGSASRRLL